MALLPGKWSALLKFQFGPSTARRHPPTPPERAGQGGIPLSEMINCFASVEGDKGGRPFSGKPCSWPAISCHLWPLPTRGWRAPQNSPALMLRWARVWPRFARQICLAARLRQVSRRRMCPRANKRARARRKWPAEQWRPSARLARATSGVARKRRRWQRERERERGRGQGKGEAGAGAASLTLNVVVVAPRVAGVGRNLPLRLSVRVHHVEGPLADEQQGPLQAGKCGGESGTKLLGL